MNLSEKMLPASIDNGYHDDENSWVWGSSVIKGEDGRYYMFVACWSKILPFHPGWLLGSEVRLVVSDNPCGPFRYKKTILSQRGQMYWDGVSVFNPRVIKHNDKYVLFYTGTTHPFTLKQCNKDSSAAVTVARTNKRIGIAVSDTIDGEWKRFDEPVITTRCGMFDSLLVTNASPCVLDDNKILVIYKARGYLEDNGNLDFIHSDMYLGWAMLDENYKIIERCNKPIFNENIVVEDPFIWKDKNKFHMIAKDMSGNLCGQIQSGMYAESLDGKSWFIHKNEMSYTREIMLDGGNIRKLGNMERPFILFEVGKMSCIYFASSDGIGSGFDGIKNTFNISIKLVE